MCYSLGIDVGSVLQGVIGDIVQIKGSHYRPCRMICRLLGRSGASLLPMEAQSRSHPKTVKLLMLAYLDKMQALEEEWTHLRGLRVGLCGAPEVEAIAALGALDQLTCDVFLLGPVCSDAIAEEFKLDAVITLAFPGPAVVHRRESAGSTPSQASVTILTSGTTGKRMLSMPVATRFYPAKIEEFLRTAPEWRRRVCIQSPTRSLQRLWPPTLFCCPALPKLV